MISFCFCGFFLDLLIINCNRDFANKNEVSENILYILGILFGVFNGASRIIFGWLMDKFGFKMIMLCISIIELAVGCSIYSLVAFDIIYAILIILDGINIGGTAAMLAPLYKKVFGIDIGPEVFGISGMTLALANLAGPILTEFYINKKEDYIVPFLIGACLVTVKTLVVLFFDEDKKFVYKLYDVKVKKKKKKIEKEEEEEEEKI